MEALLKTWQWVVVTGAVAGIAGFGGYRLGRPSKRAAAASAPGSALGTVLASYDGHEIDSDALHRRLAEEGPLTRRQMKDPALLTRYLHEWIRVSLMAQRARESGLADKPELRRELEQRLAEAYLRANFSDAEAKKSVTDADVRAYYDAHHVDFERPETFELAEIYFGPQTTATASAPARANTALEELHRMAKKDPYAFDALARRSSEDTKSRIGGGRLPTLSRTDVEMRFGKDTLARLAATPPGSTLDDTVPDGTGFAILRVIRHHDAVSPSFETLRALLRGRMEAETKKRDYDAFIAHLESSAHVAISEDAVGKEVTTLH
jgi:hypothetical protein